MSRLSDSQPAHVWALAHSIWQAERIQANLSLPKSEQDWRWFEQASEEEQLDMVNRARHEVGLLLIGENLG